MVFSRIVTLNTQLNDNRKRCVEYNKYTFKQSQKVLIAQTTGFMDDQNIDDLEEPQIVPHVAVSTRKIIRAGQFILNEEQYLSSLQKLRLFPSALWLVIFAETIIIAGFILQIGRAHV